MKVTVTINRRPEIADPEGTTIQRALEELGFDSVTSVRMDRIINLDIEGDDIDEIRASVKRMCEQVLANPVLEDFEIEVQA